MADIRKKILSFSIPAGAFDTYGRITSQARLELVGMRTITFNGTTYQLSDYPGAVYFVAIFEWDGHYNNLYIYVYGDYPYNVTGINGFKILDVDYTGFGPSGGGFSCDRCYASYDEATINSDYDQYITFMNSSTQATINGANITIVNNPSLTYDSHINENLNDPLTTLENFNFILAPSNEIKLRANNGFIFSDTSIDVFINNGFNVSHLVKISQDRKEATINACSYIPSSNFPDRYFYYFFVNSTINVVPTYVPPQTITNALTNVTNSNSASTIVNGASYTATLTPSTGYYISRVLITMGNVDITNEVYNNGAISIPSVTGDLYIEAVAEPNPTIGNNLTDCTTNNPSTSIAYGERYTATITPDTGFSLEGARVLITMGGVELYDVYSSGIIDIPSVTGDVIITIIANSLKTFEFRSMDGQTLYASITAVSLTSITFLLEGNTRTLLVNNDSFTWTSIIPLGKELFGLALTSNADRWTIPVNVPMIVNYKETLTFYEVILDEVEHPDTFNLILYKNSADAHKVDKTTNLVNIGVLSGTLREACSIMDPAITIEWDGAITFNYVYVPIYNRYYFVEDITCIKKKLVLINLKVDTLMSFKNKIYNQKGLILRNEFTYNDYIVDNERTIKENPIYQTIDGGEQFSTPDDCSIILNVVGGQ